MDTCQTTSRVHVALLAMLRFSRCKSLLALGPYFLFPQAFGLTAPYFWLHGSNGLLLQLLAL